MKELDFKIKDNYLAIGDDCFNLNEILMGEIVKCKEQNSGYAIKFTFKDDFVNKWIILVEYSTKNKEEILYNFHKLLKTLNDNNPNFKLYGNKYFLNLGNVDYFYIQKNLLSKSTIVKSGKMSYVLNHSKKEHDLLKENLTR